MPEKIKQGVRVDATYKCDDDSWELCYHEVGQPEPVVLKITCGNERFLAVALAAIAEHTSDFTPFRITISDQYEVNP